MSLIAHRYGKGRVRIMRVRRDGARHEIREASIGVMLHGDFGRSFTHADNSQVVATDSIRNLVNLAAREDIASDHEPFIAALAARFLDRYAHVERVAIDSTETRWTRLAIDGHPHPHAFALDANGNPTVHVERTRDMIVTRSGIRNYTFLKSTGSGFTGFLRDDITTLPETSDRIAATSMDASWLWSATPDDPVRVNARLLDTLLGVFATTHSASLQDSLYRMGQAALEAVPGIAEITLACPNKHYLPIDLAPLGASSDNLVFTPSDEPHGQIECTLAR